MCMHNCVWFLFLDVQCHSLLCFLAQKAFAAEFSIVIKCCVCAHSVQQTMGCFFSCALRLQNLSLNPSEKIWGSTSHEAATSLQSPREPPRRGGCWGWRGGWGCLCRGWVVLQSLHQIPFVGHKMLMSLPACYCLWEVVLSVATASILSLVCNSGDASPQPGSRAQPFWGETARAELVFSPSSSKLCLEELLGQSCQQWLEIFCFTALISVVVKQL